MSLLRNALLHRVSAIGLGLVFVYASYDKIWRTEAAPTPAGATLSEAAAGPATGPEAFARIVYRYQVVGPDARFPPVVANSVAATLPWVELLAGLLLIAGVWRREAALTVGLMLLVFIGAVASILVRGIDVGNCGCFSVGAEGRAAGLGLLAADLLMLAVAGLLAFVRHAPAAQPAPAPDVAETAAVAGGEPLTAPRSRA